MSYETLLVLLIFFYLFAKILIFLSTLRYFIEYHIPSTLAVQTANDVYERGLPTTARTFNDRNFATIKLCI